MSDPTASKTTYLYLYGSTTKPSDVLSSSIIRSTSATTDTSVTKDDYMTSGPGRYATAHDFDVVTRFFQADAEAMRAFKGVAATADAVFSESEMRSYLNGYFSSQPDAFIRQSQSNLDPGSSDYADRVYVYETVAFEIDDRARFVIKQDGTLEIQDFAVTQYSNDGKENFDFEGGWTSTLGNGTLEPIVDPSGIGRKVNIEFSGTRTTTTFTEANYLAGDQSPDESLFNMGSTSSAINTLTDNLFTSGVIKFEYDGKALVYGTYGGGSVNIDSKINANHRELAKNGIVFVGSAGDDTVGPGLRKTLLIGNEGADTLSGGSGDDEIYGGKKSGANDNANDTLKGGGGNDKYHIAGGDTIIDSDGKGSVYSGSTLLKGGKEEPRSPDDGCNPSNSDAGDKIYKDSAGNEYSVSGANLSVKLVAGGTLTIQNWSNGQLGIELKDADAGGGGGSCPPPPTQGSPLVLDLDGNGISLSSLDQSPVFFDVDNDGIAERSAWVTSGDGLLALDRNGNGIIDNANELFGYGQTISINSNTTSEIPQADGIGLEWDSGFEKLAELDTNNNGLFDAGDAQFENVRVWVDADEDGVSDEGELSSLSALGITSIGVTGTKQQSQVEGNWITDEGTFTKVDGSTGRIVDAWFNFDQQDTSYATVNLDAETAALPYIQGVGRVKDLRSAAQEDAGLKALVADFAIATTSDLPELFSKVEAILMRWHAIDEKAFGARGAYADGRHLAIYESVMDTPFSQWSGPNPRPYAGDQIESEYQLYLRNVTTKMLAQTALGQQFLPELTFENGNFLKLDDAATSATVLQRFVAAAPITNLFDKLAYWHVAIKLLDTIYESFADVKGVAGGMALYASSVEAILSTQGIDLSYDSLLRGYATGAGDDQIRTMSVFDSLSDPSEYGRSDENFARVVVAGSGNDEIHLGGGKQVLYWGEGQGSDTVTIAPFDYHGWDFEPRVEIRLPGLSLADIDIAGPQDVWSTDIGIRIKSTNERLTLQDALREDGTPQSAAIRLGDGSLITLETLLSTLQIGTTTSDDDHIIRRDGDVDGGAGDDLLRGGDGDNVYHFGIGYGTDTILELAGSTSNDAVQFGTGLTIDDLDIFISDINLTFVIRATGETLNIPGEFDPLGTKIEQFRFADGSVLTPAEVAQIFVDRQIEPEGGIIDGTPLSDIINGSDAADIINANGGADVITAGGGDDEIYGDAGSDTYVYRIGDGADIIRENFDESLEKDSLVFGAGIAVSDVTFSFSGDGEQIIIDGASPPPGSLGSWTVIVTSGTQTGSLTLTESGQQGAEAIEEFVFADGTILSSVAIAAIVNQATVADQQLYGTRSDDSIAGGAGQDLISGGAGADILNGGTGDDVLHGGRGSDTYVIAQGDGHDIIREEGYSGPAGTEFDILQFGPGLQQSDLQVRFVRIPTDSALISELMEDYSFGLEIGFVGQSQTITIATSEYGGTTIDALRFDNGPDMSGADVLALARTSTPENQIIIGEYEVGETHTGGGGDDFFVDSALGDTFIGGTGNDVMVDLGLGNDTYVYNAGDGVDIFIDGHSHANVDVVQFGPGLLQANMQVRFVELDVGQYLDGLGGAYFLDTRKYAAEFTFAGETGAVFFVRDTLANILEGVNVKFANGTVLSENALMALANASASVDQVLIGRTGGATVPPGTANESFDGGAGNDLILADGQLENMGSFQGNDIIRGGIGNDVLVGVGGNDTYYYDLGDGDDIIYEATNYTTSADRIVFGSGLLPENLKLELVSHTPQNYLVSPYIFEDTQFAVKLSFTGSSGSLTLVGLSNENLAVIETLTFSATGTNISFAPLVAALLTPTEDSQLLVGSIDDDTLAGGGGSDTINGGDGDDILSGDAGDDILNGERGNDTLSGGAGADRLSDEQGSNIIDGGEGDDVITVGASSASDITGGIGNDTIISHGGSDILNYGLGDGNDTISGLGLNGFVAFGPGISLSMLSFERVGANSTSLLITVAGGGSLLLNGAFTSPIEAGEFDIAMFGGITLDDGSNVTGNDIRIGLQTVTTGNDLVVGTSGNDILDGLAGNDLMAGGLGDDTYLFDVGSNEDLVIDRGGIDNLAFGAQITPGIIGFTRDGDDLLIEIGGVQRNALRIQGQFAGNGQELESISLADSTVITASQIRQSLLAQASTSGDDVILGFLQNDNIRAGAGDDIIISGGGSDRIDGGAGWDSVELEGAQSRYVVEQRDGYLALRDTEEPGRSIWLRNVESLNFTGDDSTSDSVVSLVSNSAPVAGVLELQTSEDTALRLPTNALLAVSQDADGGSLQVSAVSGAVGGTVTFDNTGAILFVPDANYVGTAGFDYTVRDSVGLSGTARVNIAVTAVNDAPLRTLALADQAFAEDQPVSFALPGGAFTDADGDALSLTATLVDGSALPVWLNFDGATASFSGTPPSNFNGTLALKVQASDGSLSAEGSFLLAIDAVNDAPVVGSAIGNQAVNETASLNFSIATDTFVDVDGNILYLAAKLADDMPLPGWLQFDPQAGTFSANPPLGAHGTYEIVVIVSDGVASTSQQFVLEVVSENTAPILMNAIADQLFAEDQAVSFTLPANTFADAEGDTLNFSAALSDGSVLPAWLVFDSATVGFSGQPPVNFFGSLSVVVTASDGQLTANDTFEITFAPSNDAPILAIPLADQSSLEDQTLSITLPSGAFTDVDGDQLTYNATLSDGSSLPDWLVINSSTGALTGTPPVNFNGVLDIQLTAFDGTASVSEVFSVSVVAVNDAPVVSVLLPDTSNPEDQTVNFTLPSNSFIDADGNALTLTATLSNGDALPSWLSFNASTGNFTGSPPLNLHGSFNVTVSASDGELATFDTFTLAITAVNDAPVVATLLADRLSDEDTALSFAVPQGSFSDVDNAVLSYAASLSDDSVLPSWLTFNANTQIFSGTPPLNFNGSLDVKVTASDGILSASDVFTLSITPVNDAPVLAQPLADQAFAEDSAISFLLPANAFSDVDSSNLNYSATLASGASLPGWLSFNPNTRQFSGTPPLNFFGSLDVKVTASDGALSTSDVFALNITTVNDAPLAVNDGPLAVTFNSALTISAASLLANDNDVDSTALSITSVQGAVNGSVALNSIGNVVFTPTAGFSGAASFTYSLSDGNGGSSTATVTLSVSSGGNVINGTAAANILFGTSGNDVINALAGHDIVVAGAGNDIIYAGTGSDIVEAGTGNDLIYGEAGGDILFANDGDDTAYGGDGDDIVIGANGNDIIYGDFGNDNLQGDAGNDSLYGGAGADVMFGGIGNDMLSGQAGNDIMSGNAGSDRFVFTAGFGKDQITDFQAGSIVSDVMQLSLGANFDTFAEVMAATTNVQGNAVISISASDTITIAGVSKAMLVENDFLFS